jgi:myo-inositol-1-phosphate synthase
MQEHMTHPRIGIWLVGAWGGVSTTVAVGLAALQKGAAAETALVSALPRFERLALAGWNDFLIGGHEIRRTSYAVEAGKLHRQSRVFDEDLLKTVAPELSAFDRNVRIGTLTNVGATITSLASTDTKKTIGERPAAAVERLSGDLLGFAKAHSLEHVVVVNLASTEAGANFSDLPARWADLERTLGTSTESPLTASSLYAVAAMQCGCSYINFTPSVGSNLPAICELALDRGVLHAGRDGKTGETLLKSVLAPMFAARNLKVMSWVGHNIFGNLDGKVLDDPANKASKVHSKDHLLTEILGYKPQTLVSIEYIESMADWKTAWDHIHFQGFLGTPMSMQFTWQGCDSLLAAPLVLDLVRFAERERRRKTSGVMTHLSSFFKSPMGTGVPEFHRQFELLEQWADGVAGELGT